MIVLRFKVQCRPEKTEEALAVFRAVISPSRAVTGVISFDVARDLADPNAIVAVEVFEDEAARARQESLPEVANVMALLPTALADPPRPRSSRSHRPPPPCEPAGGQCSEARPDLEGATPTGATTPSRAHRRCDKGA